MKKKRKLKVKKPTILMNKRVIQTDYDLPGKKKKDKETLLNQPRIKGK